MKSKFIVIEGLEGAGKTTARDIVIDELNYQGIKDILATREPGGTPLAEKLRTIIKHGVKGEKLTNTAELLLLYAARAQSIANMLKPTLAKGTWVVSDRHDLSSQAYQGGGREIDQYLLDTLRHAVLGDFRPDLTIYLDITPEIGLIRARRRGVLDRIEQESLLFFNRTRARYLALAEKDPAIFIIDATQPLAKVTADIRSLLVDWLSKEGITVKRS